MKKALLFLLCTIFLLTACNADTPKDTQSSDTVPPSIESTAESQPPEDTDRVLETDENGDYSIVKDLLLSDFDSFVVGKSTKEEIYSQIGNPHDSLPTSGFYTPVWGIQDGYLVLIRFDNNQILNYLNPIPASTPTETT